jgi:enamine deaminase RidA (YjgF/YER057c/UK114 family)
LKDKPVEIDHIEPGPFLSQGVAFGDMVFLAGLTADDRSLDVRGQTEQVLAKIDHYLAEAGTDKSRLLTAQIWLRNIGNWAEMNAVWTAWIGGNRPPARATVEARLAAEGLLVEIMVTAAQAK